MKDTIIIAGHQFTRRGYTVATERALKDTDDRLQQTLAAGDITRFDYYFGVLQAVATGPFEKITPEDIEAREAEEFVMGFLPPSMRTYAGLLGF